MNIFYLDSDPTKCAKYHNNKHVVKMILETAQLLCGAHWVMGGEAIIGYTINQGSVFWSIIDFIFWPLAWLKWVICQEVTLTIIKHSFDWFFK